MKMKNPIISLAGIVVAFVIVFVTVSFGFDRATAETSITTADTVTAGEYQNIIVSDDIEYGNNVIGCKNGDVPGDYNVVG